MNAQQEQRVAELQEAADHWDALAVEQELPPVGGAHPGCCANRAEMYRRTAMAIRIQIDTGIAHCACCLKPV